MLKRPSLVVPGDFCAAASPQGLEDGLNPLGSIVNRVPADGTAIGPPHPALQARGVKRVPTAHHGGWRCFVQALQTDDTL